MSALTRTERLKLLAEVEEAQRELRFLDLGWLEWYRASGKMTDLLQELARPKPARYGIVRTATPKRTTAAGYEVKTRPHPGNLPKGHPGYEAQQAEYERQWLAKRGGKL